MHPQVEQESILGHFCGVGEIWRVRVVHLVVLACVLRATSKKRKRSSIFWGKKCTPQRKSWLSLWVTVVSAGYVCCLPPRGGTANSLQILFCWKWVDYLVHGLCFISFWECSSHCGFQQVKCVMFNNESDCNLPSNFVHGHVNHIVCDLQLSAFTDSWFGVALQVTVRSYLDNLMISMVSTHSSSS